MANPARLLACVLAAGLLPSASAFPGDCTPIEAGSYTIDPRSERLAEQPTCERNYPSLPDGETVSDATRTAACAAVALPYVSSITDPANVAATEACRAATVTTDQGTVVEDACYFVAHNEDIPDATMIATKAAAVALASPECAACAAGFEPDGGFDACVVSSDASCAHSSSIWDACVADDDDLLAAMGTEDSTALLGDRLAYKELNECLAWSSLGRCQLGMGGAYTATFGEMCQWDATQPEGRRCTVKPALVEFLGLVFGSCLARSYRFPAPEGLGPPNSAADCEAIGPWCEYEMSEAGDRCHPEDDGPDGFEAAMIVVVAAAPTEVLPPPGPPPAPTPGTSAADLAAISLAAGLAGLALALG